MGVWALVLVGEDSGDCLDASSVGCKSLTHGVRRRIQVLAEVLGATLEPQLVKLKGYVPYPADWAHSRVDLKTWLCIVEFLKPATIPTNIFLFVKRWSADRKGASVLQRFGQVAVETSLFESCSDEDGRCGV